MATDTSLIEATSQFTKLLRSGYERALFAKMVERSDRDADYAKRLSFWLKRGSTLRLRELVEPFGDYWKSLGFANVVDGLDSASAHRPAA
jgi:hypothetical protein